MPYMYCHSCDGELAEPTTREILEDEWICPHCEKLFRSDEETQKALVNLLDRVEAIEKFVDVFNTKLR